MEKLVDSGLLAGVCDLTTTELADDLAGGVLAGGVLAADVLPADVLPADVLPKGALAKRSSSARPMRPGPRTRQLGAQPLGVVGFLTGGVARPWPEEAAQTVALASGDDVQV